MNNCLPITAHISHWRVDSLLLSVQNIKDNHVSITNRSENANGLICAVRQSV